MSISTWNPRAGSIDAPLFPRIMRHVLIYAPCRLLKEQLLGTNLHYSGRSQVGRAMIDPFIEPLLAVDINGVDLRSNAAASARCSGSIAVGRAIDDVLGLGVRDAVSRTASTGSSEVIDDVLGERWHVTRHGAEVWVIGLASSSGVLSDLTVQSILSEWGLVEIARNGTRQLAEAHEGAASILELWDDQSPILVASWPGRAPVGAFEHSTRQRLGRAGILELKGSLKTFARRTGCHHAVAFEFTIPSTSMGGALTLLTVARPDRRIFRSVESAARAIAAAVAQWETHRSLKDLSERVRLLTEATRTHVYDWDISTDSMTWSDRKNVFGHQIELDSSHSAWWLQYLHPEDAGRVMRSLEAAISNGDLFWMSEYRFQCADQKYIWVHDRGSLVYDADKRAVRMVGLVEDISKDRALKTQLVNASKLAAVGTLASGLVQEINNPLTWVTSNVDFALGELRKAAQDESVDCDAFEETIEALDDARAGADRIGQILSDLRTFARTSSDGVRSICVERVVEAALASLEGELRHRGRVIRDLAPVPPVMANESRLTQAISNLLQNAAGALASAHTPDARVVIRTRAEADRSIIEISDNGPGIPPDVLPRIFDPFFTTKAGGEGLGLGLAVTQSIIVGIGGSIEATSQPGVGTTFRISLPTQDRSLTSKTLMATDDQLSRGRIAVIDQERGIFQTFKRALGSTHEIECYDRSAQAVDRFLLNPPDIIFCDVSMPGLSAMAVYELLGKASPDLQKRLIVMTDGEGAAASDSMIAALSVPVLEKPFTQQQLRDLISARIGRQ